MVDLEKSISSCDARDLAAWMLSAAEQKLSGPYNVIGPLQPLTVLDAAKACIAGTGSHAKIVVASSDVARAAGLEPWTHIPFWNDPGDYGLMQASIARAAATGLQTRPLEETVRDTYAWLRSSDHKRLIACPLDLERRALASL